MQNIVDRIRNLIDDNLKSLLVPDSYIYNGIDNTFTLTRNNPVESTIKVYKGGTLLTSGYTFDETTNKVTILLLELETGEELESGDSILIYYSCYEKYSDTELEGFIGAALIYLSVGKYGNFIIGSADLIFPTPSIKEENLIAMIVSIIIKPPISSIRTPELTINFPERLSKDEKISRLIDNFTKCLGSFRFHRLTDLDDMGDIF